MPLPRRNGRTTLLDPLGRSGWPVTSLRRRPGRPPMDGVDAERLMTVADVAVFLSVGQSTVRAWVRVGCIPCLRVNGRLVRFDRRAIEDWLREPPYRRPTR